MIKKQVKIRMSVDRYEVLKRIYCRVHHLYQGFPFLISNEEAKKLGYDYLSIAEREEKEGKLSYIKVDYQ